jgi:hypothetical protein
VDRLRRSSTDSWLGGRSGLRCGELPACIHASRYQTASSASPYTKAGIITREQALGLDSAARDRATHRSLPLGRPDQPRDLLHSPGEPPWTHSPGRHPRWRPVCSPRTRGVGHVAGLRPEPPLPLDIYVPPERHVMRAGPWSFLRETAEVRSAQTDRRASAADRGGHVLDLARTGSDGDVITLVTDALRLRLTTPKRLRASLERRARHSRRPLLTELLAEADGIESGLELAYCAMSNGPTILPRAARQGRTDLPYRTDVDYEEYGLLVELDGRRATMAFGRTTGYGIATTVTLLRGKAQRCDMAVENVTERTLRGGLPGVPGVWRQRGLPANYRPDRPSLLGRPRTANLVNLAGSRGQNTPGSGARDSGLRGIGVPGNLGAAARDQPCQTWRSRAVYASSGAVPGHEWPSRRIRFPRDWLHRVSMPSPTITGVTRRIIQR